MQSTDAPTKSPDGREKSIGEILGLLEETHRGKDWILNQIKKRALKLGAKSSMDGYQILECCDDILIDELLRTLKGTDIITPEGVQMKTYYWFFSDIVAGSNPSIPTKAQVGKIAALNHLVGQTQAFKKRDLEKTIILPTGDGQAIGFGDNPENPILLAIDLFKGLDKYNQSKRGKEKLLLRVGIEAGPVYFIRDLEGKENVWGPGIIMTRRVMDTAGDTQIFVGSRLVEELVGKYPKYKEMLHLVQKLETKYGEKIVLFNLYGDGFGSKTAPVKQKKISSDSHRKVKASSNFRFTAIDISLEITNPKTMQTHHTWVWDIVNISKDTRSQIMYYIDGQVSKTFADLNVSVSDGDKNRLELGDITIDKPYHKTFYVNLPKPVLPQERITLKLEYDWEEPDRSFTYQFFSGAKKLNYSCTITKGVDLKHRILKVDVSTGSKVHATPPAIIKRMDDKTLVTWEKSNILPRDAYQFYW